MILSYVINILNDIQPILCNLIISTFSTGLRLNAALPPWVRRPSLPQERKECCTVVATCCPTVRDPTVPILFLYCSYTVPIGPSPDQQCGLLRNFTADSNSKTSLALFCVHRHKDVTFDFLAWFWLLHDNCLRTIFDLLSICTWNSTHGLIPEKAFYVGNAWWTSHTAPDRHYCRCHVQLFDVNLMPSAFTPGCRARESSTGDAEGALYVLDMSRQKSKWSRVVQETHKRQFIIQTPLFHSADFLKVSYWTWRSWRKPKAHCNAKCTDSPCLGQAESQATREQAQSLHLEASLSFGRVCH